MKTRHCEHWNGQPERLPHGFRMTKPNGDHIRMAVCEVWTHPAGWELRFTTDRHGPQVTSVARTAREMLESLAQWKAVLSERGWS
jgi:hypothetical protein